MTHAVLLCLTVGLTTGCLKELSGPQCEATPLAVTSANGDTVTVNTGLRYVDPDTGLGSRVTWCSTVIVHYDGYLADGTKFDTSRDIQRPLIFSPGTGALVDGFEQGTVGMRVCSPRRLIIPSSLAFGSEPRRNQDGEIIVPANSTVIFDIELLELSGQLFIPCPVDTTSA